LRLSEICIQRPVLTTVMSLIIVLVGLISMPRLPNRELPDVDAPIVSVTTVYPGAAAEVVETSVTQPIEDAVNGIEGVKHVRSSSREQVSSISIEFNLDRDIEAAANDVRDRVARTQGELPDEIDVPVVAKTDADARPILFMALFGPNHDPIELTRIVNDEIKDRIAKLPGVANVITGGDRRFSMRIWIDNRRLGAQNLTIAEVVAALQRENVDIPSGRVEGLDTEFTVRSLGELKSVRDYERLIVAKVEDQLVRLGDVAEVETGPEDERKLVRYNGAPAVAIGVIKQSKANTLSVADLVKREVADISRELQDGLVLEVAYDSSVFIRESITDVTRTIFEASLLVVLVIYIFLRSVRATIVPAVAIPVSIVGAFGFLYFAGFSINTLTLMGVTLAIGLVVDDAIVVLENITRWVEDGTPPMEAARRGMDEISFAVVAATVSAVSVFLPLIFLQDATGRLFAEFAVTVASAIAISGFVAVTLAPMLCARVLTVRTEEHGAKLALGRFFESLTQSYLMRLRPVVNTPVVAVGALGFAALWVGGGVWLYGEMKEELMPDSDRGTVLIWTEAPEGSTIEYMDRYQRQAEAVVMAVPEIDRVLSVVALGLGAPGVVNQGILFTQMVERGERERSQQEVAHSLGASLSPIAGINARPLNPSPLRGFGGSPVEIVVQGPDIEELARIADEIESRAESEGIFKFVRSNLVLNKPQLEVEIDRERASDLGMSMRDIATALQILLGGLDVSTFKQDGETYNVMMQLRRTERSSPRSVLSLFVRGNGQLIPLAAVADARETTSPRELPHYDRFRSVTVSASLAGGVSQGRALERMMEIAKEALPPRGGYRVGFSGEAEKFFESGQALLLAYGLAILIVYLVLAAQFESFFDPLVILVAVFLSFTGALIALWALDHSLNLFSKIGIVMLVGLVTKNSILIVEFANQLRGRGLSLADATLEACRTRFRPILMTSTATVMGILPIALGFGAGGESRAPLGVAVVGGMIFSTLLTLFVVPATYVALDRFRRPLGLRRPEAAPVAGGR
jgi:multidrug efflux pump